MEFTEENFGKYLNDIEKSALFRKYKLKELSVAKYKHISDRDKEITTEIFFMSSLLNAFGIFSMERPEDTVEDTICSNTYLSGQSFFSQKGNYYIRIKSNFESTEDLRNFLKIICDKIKSFKSLPRYLSLFEKNENKKSLVYRVDGYSKLPSVKEIFTRKVTINGKYRTVLFAKRDSNYISVGEFSNLLKNKEKKFILCGSGDAQTAFFKVNENDVIFISVYNEWIIGIADAASMAEGENGINFLYNDLKEYLRESR